MDDQDNDFTSALLELGYTPREAEMLHFHAEMEARGWNDPTLVMAQHDAE